MADWTSGLFAFLGNALNSGVASYRAGADRAQRQQDAERDRQLRMQLALQTIAAGAERQRATDERAATAEQGRNKRFEAREKRLLQGQQARGARASVSPMEKRIAELEKANAPKTIEEILKGAPSSAREHLAGMLDPSQQQQDFAGLLEGFRKAHPELAKGPPVEPIEPNYVAQSMAGKDIDFLGEAAKHKEALTKYREAEKRYGGLKSAESYLQGLQSSRQQRDATLPAQIEALRQQIQQAGVQPGNAGVPATSRMPGPMQGESARVFEQLPQGQGATPMDQRILGQMMQSYRILKGLEPATREQEMAAWQWFAQFTPIARLPLDIEMQATGAGGEYRSPNQVQAVDRNMQPPAAPGGSTPEEFFDAQLRALGEGGLRR